VLRDARHALSMIGDDKLWLARIGEDIFAPIDSPPPPDEYREIVTHLASNRWSFKHHASHDETQRAKLDIWEEVNEDHPIADLRWTIDHPGRDSISPTPETFQRIRDLGAGVVLTNDGVLGKGFFPQYRRAIDSGVRWCMGTDATDITVYPPFVNHWFAISGDTYDTDVPGVPPDQRLTRMEALRASTVNCAWFLFQDDLGSLEPGNHADLIVLSDDYFTVPVDAVREITSVLTVVGGRVVHADAEFSGLVE
jgi:predicted amidohydrolase YtcJ